jgi:hypothetical protein
MFCKSIPKLITKVRATKRQVTSLIAMGCMVRHCFSNTKIQNVESKLDTEG